MRKAERAYTDELRQWFDSKTLEVHRNWRHYPHSKVSAERISTCRDFDFPNVRQMYEGDLLLSLSGCVRRKGLEKAGAISICWQVALREEWESGCSHENAVRVVYETAEGEKTQRVRNLVWQKCDSEGMIRRLRQRKKLLNGVRDKKQIRFTHSRFPLANSISSGVPLTLCS